MNIRVVESDNDFLSLRDDWDRLAQNLLPAQKFTWMYTWWMYRKEGNKLWILVVEEDNKVIGMAPLYVRKIPILKILTLEKLCFLGEQITPYLDFLILQDQRRETVFQTLLTCVFQNLPYDILGLTDINSHYPNFDLWQKYSTLLDFKMEVSFECPKICFSHYESYNDYYKQLSKNQRQSLKFRYNKTKQNNVHIEYIFKKNITEDEMSTIANIHIKRQKFLQEKGVSGRYSHFTDQQESKFIRSYFCSGEPDSKMLACMKCNGSIVSYILLFVTKNTLSYWNTAFDTDYEEYAPTKLLINELIKYAFESKYDYFDFMRGGDSYKFQWANDASVNYQITRHKTQKAKLAYLCKNIAPDFLLPKKFRFRRRASITDGE